MISYTSRGKAFTMGNWDGPVYQLGDAQGVRYRFPRFFKDDEKILVFSDKGGEERAEIHHFDGSKKIKILNEFPRTSTGKTQKNKLREMFNKNQE